MSDFNAALKVVLEHEGGFVDNPVDHGGPTNFGITMPTASEYLGGEPASAAYIKALTPEIAGAIYRKLFWAPLGLDHIVDENLCVVIFDLAVLRGVGAMIRTIQSACGVAVDGKFGPASSIAFQRMASEQPKVLALNIVLHAQYLLAQFVATEPAQVIFLEGWIARTQCLIRLVTS